MSFRISKKINLIQSFLTEEKTHVRQKNPQHLHFFYLLLCASGLLLIKTTNDDGLAKLARIVNLEGHLTCPLCGISPQPRAMTISASSQASLGLILFPIKVLLPLAAFPKAAPYNPKFCPIFPKPCPPQKTSEKYAMYIHS